MSRLKNISKGISMGLINNMLTMLLPFVSRTIIIRQLGSEYLGLSSLFTSILQMLCLTDLGFGAAISYLLYKPIAENNIKKINSILNFLKKVYLIVGSIIFLGSCCLIPFLDKLITGHIPDDVNIYVLFAIFVSNTVISYFMFAYKKVLLSANQRYDIEVNIASCVLIMQYLIQIVLLLYYKSYYLYVIVIPIMTIINNIISFYIVNKKFPGFKPEGQLDKSEIKDILKNTSGAFCSKIGNIVFTAVDNIIISAFLGLSILGVYNNYLCVITAITAIFAVIHNSIRPVIGNILVSETPNKIWNNFCILNYGYIWFSTVCCVCCIICFQEFELLWGGSKNIIEFDTMVYLVLHFYIGRLTSLLIVYQEAAGLLWNGKFIPLISSFLNLTINLILIQFIGLKGVVIASLISLLFISLPGHIHVVFKYLFKNTSFKNNYLKSIFKYSLKFLLIVMVSNYLFDFSVSLDWRTWLFKAMLSFIVVNIFLAVISVNDYELKEFFSFIKLKLKRNTIYNNK